MTVPPEYVGGFTVVKVPLSLAYVMTAQVVLPVAGT